MYDLAPLTRKPTRDRDSHDQYYNDYKNWQWPGSNPHLLKKKGALSNQLIILLQRQYRICNPHRAQPKPRKNIHQKYLLIKLNSHKTSSLMDPSKVLTLRGLQLNYEQTQQRLQYLLGQDEEDNLNSKDMGQLKQLSELFQMNLNQPIKRIVGIERRAGISFYFVNLSKKEEEKKPPEQTPKPPGIKEQIGPIVEQSPKLPVQMIPFPKTKILDSKSILQACEQSPQIQRQVEGVQIEKINLQDLSRMKDLGKMVVIALSCTNGYPCSKQMTQLTIHFSKLLSDSGSTCFKFVKACTYSLKFHKNAMGYGLEKRYSLCLKEIGRISKTAQEMIKWSQGMLQSSKKLQKINENALKLVTNKFVANNDDREKKENSMKQAKSENQKKEVQLKDQINKFTNLIESFKEDSLKEEKRLEQNMASILKQKSSIKDMSNVKNNQEAYVNETRLGYKNQGWSLLWGFLSWKNQSSYTYTVRSKNQKWEAEENRIKEIQEQNNQKYQQISKLMKERSEILGRLLDLEKEMRKNKKFIQQNEMALHKEMMKNFGDFIQTSFSKNRLDIARKSLDTCKTLLLQIVINFQNFLKFWKGVKQQCDQIQNNLKKEGHFKVEEVFQYKHLQFLNAISNSNIQWLALGKRTIEGYKVMKEADQEMTGIINKVPTEEGLKQFIETQYKALKIKTTGESVNSSQTQEELKMEDPRQLFQRLGGSLK